MFWALCATVRIPCTIVKSYGDSSKALRATFCSSGLTVANCFRYFTKFKTHIDLPKDLCCGEQSFAKYSLNCSESAVSTGLSFQAIPMYPA